jgi:hypothetical protein
LQSGPRPTSLELFTGRYGEKASLEDAIREAVAEAERDLTTTPDWIAVNDRESKCECPAARLLPPGGRGQSSYDSSQ